MMNGENMSDKSFLFFDMDGTLIAPKQEEFHKSAIDGIQQAMKNGHHCFYLYRQKLSYGSRIL